MLDINFCEMMNPASRLRGDGWEAYLREIEALGAACGITFAQSHLPYYDLFAQGAAEKAAVYEPLIERAIVASGMLGVKWAVTHPSTVYGVGPDMRASLDMNLEYYAKHVKTAKKAGVGIALENDFEYKSAPYQRIFCADARELVALVDAFGDARSVGICYDFGHANLTGGFHRQNLRAIGKRLQAVHIADNRGVSDDHLLPFFGNIDWADAMAGLAEIGYDGDLTFEAQQSGRFFPNEHKHLVAEQSVQIGNVLIGLYNAAKSAGKE